MTMPPPGWYTDDSGAHQWWDGQRWWAQGGSAQAMGPQGPPPPAPQGPAAAGPATEARPGTPSSAAAVGPNPGPARPSIAGARWNRSRTLLVAAAAITTIGLLVLVIALLTRQPDPGDVLREYADAKISGDCDQVFAVTTLDYQSTFGLSCPTIASDAEWYQSVDAEVTFGQVQHVRDDVAEVSSDVTTHLSDGTTTHWTTVFTLVKAGGRWYVDAERVP